MTSTSENAVEEAIQKALEAPTLIDAIYSITAWEHNRSLEDFLNTGKRRDSFKLLQEQTIRRFQALDRSIHHLGSHRDVA
jgi:hypothetical protein